MKIHRVVQMLGLTQESGRLASDMYDLNNKIYRSKSTNKEIPISHMDFQHAMRTLVKFIEEEEETMIGANDIVLNEEDTIKAKDHIIDGLRSQVETLQEQNEFLTERLEVTNKAWYDVTYVKGCRYVFSEIPNDTDGQEFVDTMKKYFNKKSYKMRVKGQHLKPELYGQNRAYHGVNSGDSTHMRVYIDVKKGDE